MQQGQAGAPAAPPSPPPGAAGAATTDVPPHSGVPAAGSTRGMKRRIPTVGHAPRRRRKDDFGDGWWSKALTTNNITAKRVFLPCDALKTAFGWEASNKDQCPLFQISYATKAGQERSREVMGCPKSKDNSKDVHRLGISFLEVLGEMGAVAGDMILLRSTPLPAGVVGDGKIPVRVELSRLAEAGGAAGSDADVGAGAGSGSEVAGGSGSLPPREELEQEQQQRRQVRACRARRASLREEDLFPEVMDVQEEEEDSRNKEDEQEEWEEGEEEEEEYSASTRSDPGGGDDFVADDATTASPAAHTKQAARSAGASAGPAAAAQQPQPGAAGAPAACTGGLGAGADVAPHAAAAQAAAKNAAPAEADAPTTSKQGQPAQSSGERASACKRQAGPGLVDGAAADAAAAGPRAAQPEQPAAGVTSSPQHLPPPSQQQHQPKQEQLPPSQQQQQQPRLLPGQFDGVSVESSWEMVDVVGKIAAESGVTDEEQVAYCGFFLEQGPPAQKMHFSYLRGQFNIGNWGVLRTWVRKYGSSAS